MEALLSDLAVSFTVVAAGILGIMAAIALFAGEEYLSITIGKNSIMTLAHISTLISTIISLCLVNIVTIIKFF